MSTQFINDDSGRRASLADGSPQLQANSSVIVFATPSPSKQNKYTCICCTVKFESADLQRSHFKSDWHLYNIKRKVCNLEPVDMNRFIEVQREEAERDDDRDSNFSDYSLSKLRVRPSTSLEDHNEVSDDGADDDDDLDSDEWEKIDDIELLDEDYTDEEIELMLDQMIKSDTCLFCDKRSSHTRSSIKHMMANHGFFIPEERYLIDLEGLMNYLGFKVGAGATCLWCDKQFSTLQGVRLHMINKDHCKIMYDQSKALSEFKDYYDYSKQEHINMRPLNELMAQMRRPHRHHQRHSMTAAVRNPRAPQANGSDWTPANAKMAAKFNHLRIKGVKRFDSERAKVLLKTSDANNLTSRSRFRHQNPI